MAGHLASLFHAGGFLALTSTASYSNVQNPLASIADLLVSTAPRTPTPESSYRKRCKKNKSNSDEVNYAGSGYPIPTGLIAGELIAPSGPSTAVPVLLKPGNKRASLQPQTMNSVLIGLRTAPTDFECVHCPPWYDKVDVNAHFKWLGAKDCLHANIKCSLCGAGYLDGSDMKKHVRKIHENPKQFNCPTCPSVCDLKSSLKTPIQFVHNVEKQHNCSICVKDFLVKVNFRRMLNLFTKAKKNGDTI